jgi:hypothetical protein
MPVNPSAAAGFAAQLLDNNGVILSGGKIYTYAAGTTTPQATYTSSLGNTAHANPIILDSAGRVPGGEIWLTAGASYKFLIETSTGSLLGTYDDITGINDLLSVTTSLSSVNVSFLQAGANAVVRTAQSKMRDIVSVKDFGAVGDGVADDTVAMQAAHNTGQTVYYPQGIYQFTKITIPSGGVVGEGKLTILRTTDTSSDDVITYTGVDPTGLLINVVGGLFTNFTLLASSATQKAAGAGVSVVPAPYGGNPNENYLTIVDGIYVRDLPIGVSFKVASYFNVVNSYFAFASIAGIYADMNNALFQDNGDNLISGNSFFTNAATSPSGRGIWYRGGGARIIGNKINGGQIGIDINPLRGTSIAIVEGNSVENQTLNAIRGYISNDFIATGAFDGFSFLQFIGNQIGGYNLTGPAISIDSYAADPKFYNCTVSDNLIYNPRNYGARAIDIRQLDRFLVSNNFVDNATVGYGSLFVASTATSGLVTRNQFLRAATSNIFNSSTTTTVDQIVAEYSTTYDPPLISAGATLTLAVTVTGAAAGNYVAPSFSNSLVGITLTAYVSAADTVTFAFFNGTASPIDLASGTIRARVISS